ncbi:MAG: TPM domain-containing protein [Pseudomonadota bacterium]
MSTLLLLMVAGTLAISPTDIANPREAGGCVTDQAQVLDEATEDRLNEVIISLEQDTEVEVAVVTVDDTEITPKEFTTELFNLWGIGKAGADNGLLVVMVIGQRRLEMETGYGLEPLLTDGWLGAMQAKEMVPHFKEGDYGAGLLAGVEASAAELRRHPLEARLGTRASEVPAAEWPDPPASAYGLGLPREEILLGGLGFAVLCLLMGLCVILYRRRRTCPECGVYMPMLDEEADDAHLDAGQQREEQVHSVDWQVHACPICDHTRTFSSNRWFSGHSRCPSCRYRTRTTKRQTISAPTYTSSGSAIVTVDCAHCSYHTSRTITLPRKQRSTSSSSSRSSSGSSSYSSRSSSSSNSSRSSSRSSSRGSYGGGRSGGGGAGSSW